MIFLFVAFADRCCDVLCVRPCSYPPQYHMMTMRNTRYSMSQVFIERFDLDLVTLNSTDKLPPWYRNHLTMLVRGIVFFSTVMVSESNSCSTIYMLVLLVV